MTSTYINPSQSFLSPPVKRTLHMNNPISNRLKNIPSMDEPDEPEMDVKMSPSKLFQRSRWNTGIYKMRQMDVKDVKETKPMDVKDAKPEGESIESLLGDNTMHIIHSTPPISDVQSVRSMASTVSLTGSRKNRSIALQIFSTKRSVHRLSSDVEHIGRAAG